jgi:hypothetical protein
LLGTERRRVRRLRAGTRMSRAATKEGGETVSIVTILIIIILVLLAIYLFRRVF